MRHINWQLFSFRCAFNIEHGRTPEPRTLHVCPKSKVVRSYIHYPSAVPLGLSFLFRDRARLTEDTQKEHILSGGKLSKHIYF